MPDSKDNMTPMKGKSFTERLTVDHNIPSAFASNVGKAIREGTDPTIAARGMLEDLKLEAGFDLGKGYGVEFEGENFRKPKEGNFNLRFTKNIK